MKSSIGIGLMGVGIVGTGVARALIERKKHLSKQAGCQLVLKKALVRDLNKKREVALDSHLLTNKVDDILNDPSIDIVIEVMGGETPAFDYIKKAILKNKHIVTANKEVISKHAPELFSLAEKNNVDILFEASVGGGIPLTNPFKQDLLSNDIMSIKAIVNSTTNFILTKMSQEGLEFSAAVKQAQKLGYAEADPTNDVEGIDASYKLAILAMLAFRVDVKPGDVYREGISHLAWRDFQYAKELGYEIKLLAICKKENGLIQARVHPAFIPENELMANVNGVYNAVEVEGDMVGPVILYGKGAGALPTASAVITDAINIAQDINLGYSRRPKINLINEKIIKPMADIVTSYYIRLTVADHPGVLAQIAKTLGDNQISINSVIQKAADEETNSAEIVIMTHPARESSMQQALKEIKGITTIREVSNFIRVET